MGVEILTDVLMLARADFFIGQCWSGVSGMAGSMYLSRAIDEQKLPKHMPLSVSEVCQGLNWWPDAHSFSAPGHSKEYGHYGYNSSRLGGWVHEVSEFESHKLVDLDLV